MRVHGKFNRPFEANFDGQIIIIELIFPPSTRLDRHHRREVVSMLMAAAILTAAVNLRYQT